MAEDTKKQKVEIEKEVLESDKPVFSWKASEFAEYKKNSSWYFIIAVAGLAIAGFFAWQKNWTAVVVVVAALAALLSQAVAKPKKISCTLYRQGIVVNEKAYSYNEFKSFWIIYGEHPRIRFEQAKRLSPIINVPIDEEDPDQIKLFISKFLPLDENKGEDISDSIQRWIKF